MTDFEWFRRLLGKTEPADQSSRPGAGPRSFADDNNAFAFAMYERLRPQGGNLCFSPFSIRTALAMVQAGARGETAAQMQQALCLSVPEEAAHAVPAAISPFNAPDGGEYAMTVANSLWTQEGAPLQPAFLDLIARQFGGTVNVVDFRRNTDAARTAINRWVEDKTNRKIREPIPRGALDATMRLAVVNAVYFKGMWLAPFEEAATRDETFHVEGGGRATVPLMHQRTEVHYTQAAGYQAVDLIYRGGDLSMVILLPDRADGLRRLEKTLAVRMLNESVAHMTCRTVSLFLPRFTISWGTESVRRQLTSLGMPRAFSGQADFSGINGCTPPDDDALFISDVVHKAIVETNEKGTEAAAATPMSLWLSVERPVPTFRADHPFLFAIRDRRTGTILFLGRVADPTRS